VRRLETETTEHEGVVLLGRILNSNTDWSPRGSRVDPYMGADDWIQSWVWARIRGYVVERDRGICQVCGEEVRESPQVHHIVWRCHNGSDHPKNLMVVCDRCHRQIHARKLPLTMMQ